MKSHRIQSAWAVVAGFLLIVIFSILADTVMLWLRVFPPLDGPPMPDPLFALPLAYRFGIAVIGCWFTTKLAPSAPMRHALALGVLGVIVSTIGAIVMWKAGPPWYSLAVIAISLPSAWVGARLAGAR
jgi:hypothetical protein